MNLCMNIYVPGLRNVENISVDLININVDFDVSADL